MNTCACACVYMCIYCFVVLYIYIFIYLYIYISVDLCITCTEQVVEMLLVSKLVEAISFSNVAAFGGGSFVFSFVGSRSGLPEIPVAT